MLGFKFEIGDHVRVKSTGDRGIVTDLLLKNKYTVWFDQNYNELPWSGNYKESELE